MDIVQHHRAAASQFVLHPRCRYLAFTVLFSFIAIFTMGLVPLSPTFKNSLSILHQVPEGHVGAYWRGGALLKTMSDPGFRLKLPLITYYEPIQVTLQTDLVRDIPCGTNDGLMIIFERIGVVYRLDKGFVYETLQKYGLQYNKPWICDKIHHEISQFCSLHSLPQVYMEKFDQIDGKVKDTLRSNCTLHVPGIEIYSVHVPKPNIPMKFRLNYEQMEDVRTKGLIAAEKFRAAEKEIESQKKRAIIEAEKEAEVRKIQVEQRINEAQKNDMLKEREMEQKLKEKESERKEAEIDNEMHNDKEKSKADAKYHRAKKEAWGEMWMRLPKLIDVIYWVIGVFGNIWSQREAFKAGY